MPHLQHVAGNHENKNNIKQHKTTCFNSLPYFTTLFIIIHICLSSHLYQAINYFAYTLILNHVHIPLPPRIELEGQSIGLVENGRDWSSNPCPDHWAAWTPFAKICLLSTRWIFRQGHVVCSVLYCMILYDIIWYLQYCILLFACLPVCLYGTIGICPKDQAM